MKDSSFFFCEGGVMGQWMRQKNWAQHPLGPPEHWPLALKTTLGILFHSGHAILLFWGPENYCFYNDGYIPIVGAAKHPHALGKPGAEVWAEVWPILHPQIEQVMQEKKATFHVDHRVPIERNGRSQESYFTYSYSPVFNADGSVGGTFVVCTETTERVIAEQRLQMAMESAQMGAWHIDLKTNRVTISRELSEIIGIEGEEDVAHSIERCVHPEDREKVSRSWQDAVRNCSDYVCEYRINRPDGKLIWVLSRGRCLADEKGVPAILTGMTLDISERKKTAEALVKSEERFRTLADAIPQLVWVINAQGEIEYFNRKWVDYTGVDIGDAATWENIVHPDDIDEARRSWENCLHTGESYAADYRLRNGRTGEYRWYKSEGTPHRDQDGNILRWFGTCTDVEERKKAQLNFERNIDCAPAMLWITDKNGECTYLSRQWSEYTGQPVEEGLGLGWFKMTHPEDQKRAQEVFASASRTQEAFQVEYRLNTGAEDYRWVVDAGNPRYDSNGNFQGFVGTVFDIHEQKQAEVTLRRALEMRDEFVLIAGHELRTPVTSLKLQNQILQRKVKRGDPEILTPPALLGAIDTSRRQIDWLAYLIEDMLDVSRLAANRVSFHRERFDLGVKTEELFKSFAEQFEQQGVDAACECDPEVWIFADASRIEQVVRNLLTNAIKYGQGSPIRVTVRKKEGAAVLSVKDLGGGIAPENQERIFNRFERAVSPSAVSGLGLGLYITKQIVVAHQGNIEVRSAVGEGAEFIVTLPM